MTTRRVSSKRMADAQEWTTANLNVNVRALRQGVTAQNPVREIQSSWNAFDGRTHLLLPVARGR